MATLQSNATADVRITSPPDFKPISGVPTTQISLTNIRAIPTLLTVLANDPAITTCPALKSVDFDQDVNCVLLRVVDKMGQRRMTMIRPEPGYGGGFGYHQSLFDGGMEAYVVSDHDREMLKLPIATVDVVLNLESSVRRSESKKDNDKDKDKNKNGRGEESGEEGEGSVAR